MTLNSPDGDILVGAASIARHLNITPTSLYMRVSRGTIPVGRLGNQLCASKQALAEYLDKAARGLLNESPARPRGRPRKHTRPEATIRVGK
ncbi:MAG: hypothetical protein U1E62_21500 [Alsobacter sp.]